MAPSESEGGATGLGQGHRPLVPGTRFGAYFLRELIGSGALQVYRAEHETLGQDVALQVFATAVAPGPPGVARFMQEARIIASIQHPNVVHTFDAGVQEGVPYLVMEPLQGQGLDQRLRSEGVLDEQALIEIAIPIVSALMAVHAAGVLHRDLKPASIFLAHAPAQTSLPKLLDFGISRPEDQGWELSSAGGQRGSGTPLYRSPEALLGRALTAASDQYSLGAVLYECVTGVNPFAASNLKDSVQRITSGRRPAVLDHEIQPSRQLAAVIERALSVDPRQRFPDLAALGRELLPLAEQRTRLNWELNFLPDRLLAERRPFADRAAERGPGPPRRNALVLTLAAVGWLAAVAFVILRLVRRDEDSVVLGPPGILPQPPTAQYALQPPRRLPAPVVAREAPSAESPRPPIVAPEPRAGRLPNARANLQFTETSGTDAPLPEAEPPSPEAKPPSPEPEPSAQPRPDWQLEPGAAPGLAIGQARPDAGARRIAPLRGTNNAPIFE